MHIFGVFTRIQPPASPIPYPSISASSGNLGVVNLQEHSSTAWQFVTEYIKPGPYILTWVNEVISGGHHVQQNSGFS